MAQNFVRGLAAGAVGTMALDITTYLDMLLQGRGPSSVPAHVVQKLAEQTGVSELATPDESADEKTKNRRSSAGSLLGYGVGLSIGGFYGLLRPALKSIPTPVMGLLLGAAAMAASDVPATKLGVTDPSTWPASSWASDIIPHAIYGVVTALAYDTFS